jgi:hypothetical protein
LGRSASGSGQSSSRCLGSSTDTDRSHARSRWTELTCRRMFRC